MEKIKEAIQDLISYLIYDRYWDWLHLLISTICDLEMQIPLLFNRELKDELDRCDIIYPTLGETKSIAKEQIPEQTFYCEGCPYSRRSEVARFLFGSQSCGYCYYLGKGDYSFLRATCILWDGCKECGINEFDDE